MRAGLGIARRWFFALRPVITQRGVTSDFYGMCVSRSVRAGRISRLLNLPPVFGYADIVLGALRHIIAAFSRDLQLQILGRWVVLWMIYATILA